VKQVGSRSYVLVNPNYESEAVTSPPF